MESLLILALFYALNESPSICKLVATSVPASGRQSSTEPVGISVGEVNSVRRERYIKLQFKIERERIAIS